MKPRPFRPAPFVLAALSAVLAVGCGKTPAPAAQSPAAKPEATLAGAHESEPATAAMPPETSLTGTILETMDSGEYTYMKLATAEGETWAAINQTKVTKGSTVTIANPMRMDGFESKTLNRKFDRIVFGTLAPAGAAAPAGGAPAPASNAALSQHAAAAAGPEVTEKISVPKADGPDGRTIAEVYALRRQLDGKTVAVRGKVVKLNTGIMGRNWIHLRDGTGTRDGKNDDLTVTTNDSVATGEVVVATGKLGVDRDFGAGYAYTVVVEGAKITK